MYVEDMCLGKETLTFIVFHLTAKLLANFVNFPPSIMFIILMGKLVLSYLNLFSLNI